MATFAYDNIIPSKEEIEKIVQNFIDYNTALELPKAEYEAWTKKNFPKTPWGISYLVCPNKHKKSVMSAAARGAEKPKEMTDVALRYFYISVLLGWDDLTTQLKRTLHNWGITQNEIVECSNIWKEAAVAKNTITLINNACKNLKTTLEGLNIKVLDKLIEAIEKHDTLNTKLFTKEAILRETVRKKMLEIVNAFLDDLKEQKIDIKVKDILLIGSNASYNYTKDSDIDLHILADTKATKYSQEIAEALYSAYRSLFNKTLDIQIYDIPLEIFVETDDTPRISNGVYSVKKDKWIKKPVHEEIPEYDKAALDKLVAEWETKYLKLVDKIKADKLEDETQVIKLLEAIYDKLRKTGIAKSEYAIENLAFKELRNKGYLDELKKYKNELMSKRLSLTERMSNRKRQEAIAKITSIVHTQPIIQDNGLFYVYNMKESDAQFAVKQLKTLTDMIEYVSINESGKYDFNNINHLLRTGQPAKYYSIRGQLKADFIN